MARGGGMMRGLLPGCGEMMMATSERARHELYARLEEVLGAVYTDTLMAHLPPSGWGDVATKQDLRELRGEMEQLRSELGGEMSQLRRELHGDMDRLEQRVMSKMYRAMAAQTGALLLVLAGASFAPIG